MMDLLDKLLESIQGGNFALAAVVLVVAIVFNLQKIVNFLESRKRSKIEKLTDALESEHLKGGTRSLLERELESEHFKLATGIYLEREFREALIKIHQKAKGELSFRNFRRALPHLKYVKQKVNVVIDISDKVGYWLNMLSGSFLMLFSLLLLVLTASSSGLALTKKFSGFGFGVFFAVFGFVILAQTIPVSAAKRIKKHIETLSSSSSA